MSGGPTLRDFLQVSVTFERTANSLARSIRAAPGDARHRRIVATGSVSAEATNDGKGRAKRGAVTVKVGQADN